MQLGKPRVAVCCLLSAVLWANNGLPLVLKHAHPVGSHLEHDSAAHDTHRPPRGNECSAAVIAVTAHVHLVWLGFEFTLLPPDSSGPNSPDSGQDELPSAVGSLAQWAESRSFDAANSRDIGRQVGVEHFAALPLACCEPGCCGPRAATWADSRRVAALPLCDTARHERSGVQLI